MSRFVRALLVILALAACAAGAVRADEGDPARPQVVGGGDVPDPSPYPYQAFVGLAGYAPADIEGRLCGGSLIATRWVLAAAHCFDSWYSNQPSELQVVLGVRTLSQARSANIYQVGRIVPHPGYDPAGRQRRGEVNTEIHDIALLELARPVTAVAPIQLIGPAAEAARGVPGALATLTGWGGVKSYPPGGSPSDGQAYPDTLQSVELPIIDPATCAGAYAVGADSLVDGSWQLCAGYMEGGKDGCQGDSGGPLALPDGLGGYQQVGVVSFGAGCAAPGYPGVYTRVSAYTAWVNSVIASSQLYLPSLAR